LIELDLIGLSLHITEVEVALKLTSLGSLKATESLIAADLMSRGHLESAHRCDAAVVLYCVYNEGKSVKLCEVLGWDLNLLFLAEVAEIFLCLGSTLAALTGTLLGLGLTTLPALFTLSLLHGDELLLGVSFEVGIGIVHSCLVLIVQLWQLCELEVLGQSPVELLHWELIHAGVSISHCDVVISVQT
jgi:hypothetical protein